MIESKNKDKSPQIYPDKKDLRNFGILFSTLFVLFLGVILPYILYSKIEIWPFLVVLPLLMIAIFFPKRLAPLFKIWLQLGNILAYINTRIILGFVFALLFFPTGILVKMFGKDLLNRKISKSEESYRIISKTRDANHFEKPF